MFWISTLSLVMAAALVKLGVASIMVSMLLTALSGPAPSVAILIALVGWQAWRCGQIVEPR